MAMWDASAWGGVSMGKNTMRIILPSLPSTKTRAGPRVAKGRSAAARARTSSRNKHPGETLFTGNEKTKPEERENLVAPLKGKDKKKTKLRTMS